MVSKKIRLEKLNIYWDNNCNCELRKTATQAVFGAGNVESDIVFIGEAPGKNEDLKGIPFVGASGKFFDEMLNNIGMVRESIYITNIVKYRPPNNRDPNKDEKEACISWIQDELKIIKPKLIIFLGRHSMLNFFPKEKISEVHGKLLIKNIPELGEQSFLPLYHPAAALYNGSMRKILINDFNKIPKILARIK
jgi:uracil-DNA glycosylase